MSTAQSAEVKAVAKRIADTFDYMGVLPAKLFMGRDGTRLIDEIAPRVRKSGAQSSFALREADSVRQMD